MKNEETEQQNRCLPLTSIDLLDRRINFNGGCRKMIMNDKLNFYCDEHHCDCFEDAGSQLETENAELREAVSHFFSCRTCAEDSVFNCFDGITYAQKFNLIAETEKAV